MDKYYYTLRELNELLRNHEIVNLDYNESENYKELNYSCEKHKASLMIPTDKLASICVEMVGGYYATVATGLNGKKYMVVL